MSNLSINITESPETLLELLEKQTNKWCYLKVQILYWLKTEKVSTIKEISQKAQVNEDVVGKWIRIYKRKGINVLIKNPNEPKIPQWVVDRLFEELKTVKFTPDIKTITLWLATVGYSASEGVANVILYSLLPQLSQFKEQESINPQNPTKNTLFIDKEIYQEFKHWKQENKIQSDSEALNELMTQFFDKIELNTPVNSLDLENTLLEKENNEKAPVSLKLDLLNQSQLAERLNITNGTLSRYRKKPIFSRWSQQRDPDNISWEWNPTLKKYQPFMDESPSI